jgi:hypothetical protein
MSDSTDIHNECDISISFFNQFDDAVDYERFGSSIIWGVGT